MTGNWRTDGPPTEYIHLPILVYIHKNYKHMYARTCTTSVMNPRSLHQFHLWHLCSYHPFPTFSGGKHFATRKLSSTHREPSRMAVATSRDINWWVMTVMTENSVVNVVQNRTTWWSHGFQRDWNNGFWKTHLFFSGFRLPCACFKTQKISMDVFIMFQLISKGGPETSVSLMWFMLTSC